MDDEEWETKCGVRGGEAWSGSAGSIQNRLFLERGVPGEIGHGLPALSSHARIYAWERSVAEFPCSLRCLQVQIQQEFNICYLDMLFWITICKHTLRTKSPSLNSMSFHLKILKVFPLTYIGYLLCATLFWLVAGQVEVICYTTFSTSPLVITWRRWG